MCSGMMVKPDNGWMLVLGLAIIKYNTEYEAMVGLCLGLGDRLVLPLYPLF